MSDYTATVIVAVCAMGVWAAAVAMVVFTVRIIVHERRSRKAWRQS